MSDIKIHFGLMSEPILYQLGLQGLLFDDSKKLKIDYFDKHMKGVHAIYIQQCISLSELRKIENKVFKKIIKIIEGK